MDHCNKEEEAPGGVCGGGGDVDKGQMEGSRSCMRMVQDHV